MDDWRACSVTQLGLYVGLFQLFVADKISHKGCFTLQARCPAMVFLEERSHWESRPGPRAMDRLRWAMVCASPLCLWQEGRVSCSAWGPCTRSPSAHPQGAELQPQQTVWGRRCLYRCPRSSLDAPFCSPQSQRQRGHLWVPATGWGFCW